MDDCTKPTSLDLEHSDTSKLVQSADSEEHEIIDEAVDCVVCRSPSSETVDVLSPSNDADAGESSAAAAAAVVTSSPTSRMLRTGMTANSALAPSPLVQLYVNLSFEFDDELTSHPAPTAAAVADQQRRLPANGKHQNVTDAPYQQTGAPIIYVYCNLAAGPSAYGDSCMGDLSSEYHVTLGLQCRFPRMRKWGTSFCRHKVFLPFPLQAFNCRLNVMRKQTARNCNVL